MMRTRKSLAERPESIPPLSGSRPVPVLPPQQPAPVPVRQPPQPEQQAPPQQPGRRQPPAPADLAARLREHVRGEAREQPGRQMEQLPHGSSTIAALMNVENALMPGRIRGDLQFLGISLENEACQRTITGTWLREEVIPLAPSSDTPRVRTERPSFFIDMAESTGYQTNGLYSWGSDEVHVTSESMSPADRLKLITHEDLHYFSREGRSIHYQQENGREARPGFVRWLNEGLTELFAQHIARENGFIPNSVAYPYETIAAHYLLMAVSTALGDEQAGRNVLMQAYITGDFTQVRVFTDMAMGPGTFDRFMSMGTGAEACEFLRSRIPAPDGEGMIRMRGAAAGIPHSRWTQDPVVRLAELRGRLEAVMRGGPGWTGFTLGRD